MASTPVPITARLTSLRSKFLLVMLGAGVLPLGLVGLWLTRSTQRSGEALLRSRLDATLVRAAQETGQRWVTRRSALLGIGDDPDVRRLLRESNSGGAVVGSVSLPVDEGGPVAGLIDLREAAQLVIVSDARSKALWILDADSSGSPVLVPAADSLRVLGGPSADVLPVRLPVQNAMGTDTLGLIEARFRPGGLVPVLSGSAASGGAVFAVVDRRSGAVMASLPFDPALMRRDRFTWGGEEWFAASRTLDDPEIEILAAMPAGAFTLPFEDAARRGIIALALVAVAGFTLTIVLTRRITRSLVQLVDAAEAVTRGDLDRRVEPRTRDEVGRLASAFNAMTDSLRTTLGELSQRQAIAAVGEFASALAHEIRNPLSAIRLNLQHLEERVSDDAALRDPVGQVLRDVNRLDQTVAGALRVARTGRMTMERTDLRVPLEAAVRGSMADFERRRAVLDPLPAMNEVYVRGNSAALEQLFLNLLLNAAQACEPGGHAGVELDVDGDYVNVTIRDSGSGFADDAQRRAFEPFFTTKAEGTGLGLTVARRIVASHGGRIDIESPAGAGTRVRVRLLLGRPNGLRS
jgi:signal transduction histidine kinase